MGRLTRFVRKVTGRTPKKQNGDATSSNVGVARIVAVPSLQHIHNRAPTHPAVSIRPSHRTSTPGLTPVMALPTLAPIQPVSPIRLSTAVRSTSPAPAPNCSISEPNDDFGNNSHATEQSTDEESFQCRGISPPLPREDKSATIFHAPTPPLPPRLTSTSFARLPQYVGSSESDEDSEVPRTGHGSFHSDVDDSDSSDMLRPLEVPAQKDIFSGSSSPSQPGDRDAFSLPGPPIYHGWPLAERVTPCRPSHLPGSVAMMDGPTFERGAHAGTSQRRRGRSSTRRRSLTPYPVRIPQHASSPSDGPQNEPTRTLQGSETQTPHLRPRMVHLPPPTPPSDLGPEISFFTRMEPLPSSTPLLPRSDDFGIDLQDVLRNHVFFPHVREHSSGDEAESRHGAISEENWVEYAYERTTSERDEAERSGHENSENFS